MLPAERTSFVGRRGEVAAVRRALSGGRLVTLTGPGGVGKTRLALRAAGEARAGFRDGVHLADLSALRDPALVPQQVAGALDIHDRGGGWLAGAIAEVIGRKRLLLVLDNCEQVRDPCAVLVDTLLGACPHLHVLATSRQPLDVAGERLLPVPPLPAPAPGEPRVPGSGDAVDLLLDRARAVAPDLRLSPADEAVAAELCRRLDGIPLAVELAAVRLRTLTPTQVLARLDDRFRLLRHPRPAAPQRHQTLRATLEWSYDLLEPQERLLWVRAAVFAADFDLPAAEHVCADARLSPEVMLDTLTALVDKSVLEVQRQPEGPRFWMLETIRAFGRQRLDASAEWLTLLQRHRDWYAGLTAAASAEFTRAGQVRVFNRLEAEHAELRAALEHCGRTPGQEPVGVGMAADLWLYWEARGHLGEGRRWLAQLLPACAADSRERARGLAVAGYLALAATDPEGATPLLEEALAAGRRLDEPFVVAFATQYLGLAALFQGDLDTAGRLLREAAALHRTRDLGLAAFAMADAGIAALFAGSYQAAAEALADSLALNQGGDPWTRSHALWGLGLVRWLTGSPGEAVSLEREALGLMREVDNRSGVALCVEALAWLAAGGGRWEHAARLVGAAEAVWRSIPAQPPVPVRPYRDACIQSTRRALGEPHWAARHAEGLALTRAQAVALALGEAGATPPARPRQPPGPAGAPLTRRQQQVAALVAEGLTDREIAARLVISPRTAESHVEQILTRLGFRSRAQIAAWVGANSPAAMTQPPDPRRWQGPGRRPSG
jgi:predicted ATPase/DNA-binding CsgD family transcriptional regulator